MSRILIFRRGNFCYNSLNVFSQCLASSLEKLGYSVVFFDVHKEGTIDLEEVSVVREYDFDAAIAFNAGGQHNTCLPDGRNLFDAYEIPFFNYIVDHPLAHHGNMTSTCSNYYVICVDGEHKEYVDRHYPRVKEAFFLPLAGLGDDDYLIDSFEDYKRRPFQLGFTGSFDDFRVLDEEISGYPTLLQKIINAQIDILLSERNLGIEQSLTLALDSMNLLKDTDISFEQYAVSTRIVNRWIKAYIREEAIRYLAAGRVPIHIWGSGWEKMRDLPNDSLIVHPAVAYESLPEICQNTQICFNNMPWFKQGMHDRVPTAMLAGAMVLSDSSRYVDRLINEYGEVVCLYDISQLSELPGLVNDLIKSPEKCYEIATHGKNIATECFTWNDVARKFAQIVDGL
ncbi:MAG: hypothetical protein K5891_02600 [Lachnospiraceae bacterium]|nr:hypothetical protein [Lachnospiraceae bacterium]